MRSMLLLSLLLFTVELPACGYTLLRADNIPSDVRTLRVERVDVGEGDPLLADALTRRLRREIRRGGRFQVAEEGSRADAVLSVRVVADRSRPVAFNEFDSVLDYQMTLAADAALARSDGELLWKADRISSSRGHAAVAGAVVSSSSSFQAGERLDAATLTVFDDVQLGEERKAVARERLVADLASSILATMGEGI